MEDRLRPPRDSGGIGRISEPRLRFRRLRGVPDMTTSAKDDRRVPTKAKVEHPIVAERVARGQAARADVPRSAHAEFAPSPDRPDPISLLERQETTRVPSWSRSATARMQVSPFTFYRGAALIMAADLATTPTTGPARPALRGRPPVQLRRLRSRPSGACCSTSTTSTRPCPGPFEWDVKRLAASLEVAGRDRGFADADRDGIVRACVRAYRTAMAEFPGSRTSDVFYTGFDIEQVAARYRASVSRKLAKQADRASPRRAPRTACRPSSG